MRKQIMALLLGGALTASAMLGLAACGKKEKKLTLWGPSAQQESLKEMVDEFLKQNPDFGLEIDIGVAGEGDAYAMMSNDPQSGADVYAYANDQVVNLYSLGALARLSDSAVAELKQTNTPASVEAGKVGEGYYGYPYAADNGFFLYYDKSVVSEEQAETLEGVIEACAAKRKNIIYQFATGWYVGSFMYGAGGEYTATYEGATVKEVTCNFDQKMPGSNYTYGEIGGQQLIDFYYSSDWVTDGDDTVISNKLTDGVFGACISGTWNAELIQSYLKENYAATVLPKWTSSLDGKTYDWKSFAGYKLYGVNSFSKNIEKAHQLAAFLSSQSMQEKRFDDNQIGPSNTAVAAMDKVKENIAISTITRQIAENSVIQTAMPSSYWSEMESFGNAMKAWKNPGDDEEEKVDGDLLKRVQALVAALKG